MGFDDAVCDLSPTGEHQLERTDLVVTGKGPIDQVHGCRWCGAEAVELAGQDAARPPL